MKLEVSKLMDHYTDTEFCPKENDFVDTGAIQDRVMAQAAPARRKRRWGLKLMVAIAAAVACVGMMAAGLPIQVYHMLTGGSIISDVNGTVEAVEINGNPEEASPIALEGGRLILTVDGQRIDVTDLINESTPYIYTHSDPDTGVISHLIVGGTTNDFGYLEYTIVGQIEAGNGWNYNTTYYVLGGQSYLFSELTQAQKDLLLDPGFEDWSVTSVDKPWYAAAKEMLSIQDC